VERPLCKFLISIVGLLKNNDKNGAYGTNGGCNSNGYKKTIVKGPFLGRY
jgi:hypothetical protein